MNAYELADELLRDNTQLTVKSAYMLRQQADRIAELEKQNKPIGVYDGKRVYITTPQTKPLSDEEIDSIIYSVDWAYDPVLLARAIEERHGIK